LLGLRIQIHQDKSAKKNGILMNWIKRICTDEVKNDGTLTCWVRFPTSIYLDGLHAQIKL